MRVIYNGPHPEVVVDEFDPETVIEAGKPVNVPDELGARLLEQDTWSDASDDQSTPGRALAATKARDEQSKTDAGAVKPQDDSTEGNS